MANPQTDGGRAGEETAGKVEDADSWEGSPSGPTKGGAPPTLVETPPSPAASASQGGVALKVGAPGVLQPFCLGEGPLVLPIHLQVGGAAGPPLGPMGAPPCFLTGGGALSLPLVLDQQLLQHLGSGLLPQGNMLIQNASLSFGPPPPLDQKPSGGGHFQDANVLALLQNPAFAALLQDLFSSQTGSSSFQASPGPALADSFANAGFFAPPPPPPPPGSHPYSSPLAPLVPPATLLVPYPVVIPLPVPLPIPLPIPVPVVPPAEDSKGSVPRAVCTVSRGTQTAAAPSPSLPAAVGPPPLARSLAASPSSPPPADGEALDLSVRTCPLQPKLEPPCLQDDVLDLSVPGGRRCAPPSDGAGVSGTAALSLGVLRPVECSAGVDSKLLRGLTASLEFSRKHKWLVEGGPGGSGTAGTLELVGTSQTAKVIVSVKDAIPAILCGKLKGLSGVSTKNFSIKRDGSQAGGGATALQQLCGVAARGQGEPSDSGNPHRKLGKSRAIKLKKVSAQEIHLVPIKKQRLAAFLPRK